MSLYLRRTARLALALLEANLRRPRRPLKLTLSLTQRCSMACRYCRIWTIAEPAEPDLETLGAFFARNPHVSWIDLIGGEIFEREDIPQIFALLDTRCHNLFLLHFPTNGWWTRRILDAVEGLRRRRFPKIIITVSIDGPAWLHDRLRGRAGAFDRAVETLRALRRLDHVQVFAGMTLGPDNFQATRETHAAIARRVPGFRPDELHVNFLNRSPHYFRNLQCQPVPARELATTIEAVRRWRGWPRSPEHVIEDAYLRLVPRFLRTGRTPIRCLSLESNCFVDADWTLYPCTLWNRPLGNLLRHGLALHGIWKSPGTRGVRRQIEQRACPNCWTPCEAYPSLLGIGRTVLTA